MNSAKSQFSAEIAEEIAINALLFLVGDQARALQFFTATGLTSETLRERANSADMMCAVLDHLLGDESLLLVFCASDGVEPKDIARAQAVLAA